MRDRQRVIAGGLLIGVGMGGFVDGILLHQVLQWHHMLSSHGSYPTDTVAGLRANVVADGIFHVVAWLATVAGLMLVWTAARERRLSWPQRGFLGLLLAGWGLFNLVEGIINHHLLGLHNVRDDVDAAEQVVWNVGFLVSGVLLVAVGYLLARPITSPGAGQRSSS